jgi:uncharacterized MAPEG superfamily protein
METYGLSIIGLLVLCLIPIVLANIVGPFKGRDKLIGGPVADARDDYVVFRLDRTHVNSVESIPVFIIPAILAMMVGIGPGYLAVLVWAFLAIRLVYAVVYVRGGAIAKGGNLRTVIHVLGSLVTIVLIGSVFLRVL